jgi:NAD(P)-dependent dehydrogenase (short-subunit alcohol dehydrogenase family)
VVNYPSETLQGAAQKVVESLTTPGIMVEADLSTLDGPAKLVDGAVEAYGQIDILVNNAAVAVNLPFSQQTLEHWDRLVNLNGRGTFLLTQTALPHLPRQSDGGGGRIVNVVSSSARDPPVGQTIYAGTKGMLDSFTKCWAKELPPICGCTVNAVSPGGTRTEGFAEVGPEVMKYLQPSIDATPCAPRLGEVEEVAFAVAFLCEERARWVNGTHLSVNGGLFVG